MNASDPRAPYDPLDGPRIAAALRTAHARRARARRRALALTCALVATAVLAPGVVAALLAAGGARAVPGWSVALAAALGVAAAWLRARLARRADELDRDVLSLELMREVVESTGEPLVRYASRPAVVEPPRSATPWAPPALAAVAFAVIALLIVPARHDAPAARRWMFTEPAVTPRVLGLRTPRPEAGEWRLEAHAPATGGRALVSRAGQSGERPGVAVDARLAVRDVRAATRCKPAAAPRGERACGLVFRYVDADHHYVARVDAAARRVALDVVERGRVRTIGSVDAAVAADRWHDLTVEARASRITVRWNGRRVLEAHDATLATPGSAGLWAPSDTVAYFDELDIVPLAAGT